MFVKPSQRCPSQRSGWRPDGSQLIDDLTSLFRYSGIFSHFRDDEASPSGIYLRVCQRLFSRLRLLRAASCSVAPFLASVSLVSLSSVFACSPLGRCLTMMKSPIRDLSLSLRQSARSLRQSTPYGLPSRNFAPPTRHRTPSARFSAPSCPGSTAGATDALKVDWTPGPGRVHASKSPSDMLPLRLAARIGRNWAVTVVPQQICGVLLP